jgi:acetylornithine/N-succinyldiaminopimelate aminotransferase
VYKRAPVEFVRGVGVDLFDADDRAYLDLTSGIAVNALGYGDQGLAATIHEALERGIVHLSNLYESAPARELARELVALAFPSRVFFCNSGAEANEGAFKIARRWAREQSGAKHEIIALRGGFHGRLFASLAATDRPAYRAPFRPLAGGVTIVERDLKELDAALREETVAAVILEPEQGEGGVRVLPHELLQGIREMTAARGIALIADEIQSGLGRTGSMFAYEHAGIVPDIVTLAKPLAGGLPMGAVLASEEIASAMRPGDHGSTFGGGPLVAAVARYVVKRLSAPALLSHVRTVGEWLGHELTALAARTARVRAVRGTGFMWGIDVTGSASDVVGRARENGVLVCSAGEHTIRLLPPLVATRDELELGLGRLEEALA